jgi:hypothetical protein
MRERSFVKHSLVLALASALTLAGAASAVSCKKNVLSSDVSNGGEVCAAQVSQMVGPSGGDVIGPDNAEVKIPAGALSEDIAISICKLQSGYPAFPADAGWAPAPGSGVYGFEPHGTVFQQPVTLRIPYIDPGAGTPVRLVAAQPDAMWTTVDGVPVSNGFATASFTHFSYFSVITGDGAEPPPTNDGGADAETDATTQDTGTPDSGCPNPSGPAASPAVFAVASAGGAISRFDLTPSTVVTSDGGTSDSGAFDGGDAGSAPSVTLGQFTLGPSVQLQGGLTPSSLAMASTGGAAPYTLYAGGVVASDAGAGAVASAVTPFGTPSLCGSFPVPDPTLLAYDSVNAELWISTGAPPEIETWAGGMQTWPSSAIITAGSAFSGIALDTAGRVLYLSDPQFKVERWQFSGTGAAKQAVQLMPALSSHLVQPTALAVAPWGELLVVDASNGNVVHFDLSGNYVSTTSTGLAALIAMAPVQWPSPSGVEELLLADGAQGIFRVVLDASHSPIGSPAMVSSQIVTQMITAP